MDFNIKDLLFSTVDTSVQNLKTKQAFAIK